MKTFTKEEYFELCKKLLEENEELNYNDLENLENSSWIPGESEHKAKIKLSLNDKIVDLSKTKSSEIKEKIKDCVNIRVEDFLIRSRNSNDDFITFYIYEEKKVTPSGNSCKMSYKINLLKDTRFNKCSWISYVMKYDTNTINNMPKEELVNVVRWLQGICKMKAFM